MPVLTRIIESVKVGAIEALGAVQDQGRTFIGFTGGHRAQALLDALGCEADIHFVGRSALANLTGGTLAGAAAAETALFAGKSTLVAFRNGETASAASDWVAFHAAQHGAEAALIFDRAPPDGRFAQDLAAFELPIPAVVVTAETPLGLDGGLDARHAGLAPAAPTRTVPPIDPWHAPLGQFVIYELMRRRFLQKAKAVAFVDIADLVMPEPDYTMFDHIELARGRVQILRGKECYPWRLRQGAPAPHSDHVATRRAEDRWVSSWGTVPDRLPDDALWRPGRVAKADVADTAPLSFRRAMGVVFPSTPVKDLVKKADLVEDSDLLAMMQMAFEAQPIRLPKRKTIPPRPKSPKITVVTAMKNEGPFVLDWIAHNLAIGVDRHLVYTNDCDDGTDRLLDVLSEAGIERRDNPYQTVGKVPQYAAFSAAEHEVSVQDAGWLLTLDVDEYINIHVGDGLISDLLDARPEAHVFSMPWRLFGNSGRHVFEDQPVTEVFTKAAPEYAPRPLQAWAFKSIYRNEGLFRRLGVHRPKGLHLPSRLDIQWVDGSGRAIPPNTWQTCWRMSKANWGYDLVTLNHYAVRSAESFLVKRDRGRVNHVDRDQGLAYWFRMNHNAEEDLSIQRLAKRTAAQKTKLLALPGVAEAHQASVVWHRAKVDALKADPQQAELYARITSPRLENLSRMATKFGANVHFYGPDVIPDEVADQDPETDFFFSVDPRPA